jgi:hypothetical protein
MSIKGRQQMLNGNVVIVSGLSLFVILIQLLKGISGSKREEVVEDQRKLQNEELCNLCSSSDIIRVIKSKMMRWVGHVACME